MCPGGLTRNTRDKTKSFIADAGAGIGKIDKSATRGESGRNWRDFALVLCDATFGEKLPNLIPPSEEFRKKKKKEQTTREKRFYRFTREDRSEVLLYTRYKERACVY